ncbi:glycoside hydrolase family 61 protein [Trichoderma atroviride IMI 206040]|uniref:lytic cellulose monooxygenase (C4-dehydrogenating) n=1 Tax=Hypocrea atroviridis (strain ATCC 20476 / IMI 206040) TaxID=452589 RepID=G9NS04_HYPAI|nr:glycoside hydrolase family 61 protein [Trichoderma atroviride IMI 206040]EHK46784.1 glycoside hydrolase family 61 protein [Trichoderma atroviride IMI 206040]
MAQKLSNLFAIALTVATGVVGHGHVNNIVVNGVYYQGYDPTSFPYMPDPPIVVGWTAADTDNGFVSPDAYQTPDIVCHKNGTNAKGHASVKAGDSVLFQWVPVPWPHKSTVVDYLANCNGPCETVDKTTLEFFKIDGIGLLSGGNPGTWGSDVLIGNNNTWVIQIPEDLQTGNYVLRHELIALHSAEQADGAQNYPQCFNLAVTGTGSLQPSGVLATDLYHETDPGILFNIYTSPLTYIIPGPTVVSGLPSSVAQASSAATATSSATVSGGGGGSSTGGSTSKTTTVVRSTTSVTSKASSSTAVTTPPPAGGTQTLYGQCGGSGYSGPTKCASPAVCTTLNPYYAQCLN